MEIFCSLSLFLREWHEGKGYYEPTKLKKGMYDVILHQNLSI